MATQAEAAAARSGLSEATEQLLRACRGAGSILIGDAPIDALDVGVRGLIGIYDKAASAKEARQ